MCGVTGFIQADGFERNRSQQVLERMVKTLVHRGPDDSGLWLDSDPGVAIGHRRLSIIDRTSHGAQPMVSACGRFVLSYNGELYNTRDLAEAAGIDLRSLRGYSDTEVLLESCAATGVEITLKRCIGMFAFALWDREERKLYLARDRLGIKPMYWSLQNRLMLFGSELKALRAHHGWRAEIAPDAIAAYLRYTYVPGPLSVYRGVYKLMPGCFLSYRAGEEPRIEPFWSLSETAQAGAARFSDASDSEVIGELDALINDAVKRRIVADVPLGAFLSGGVDSSTIVAMLQKWSDRPAKTFSIAFEDARFDESANAREVARLVGTEHHELPVTSADAMALIPDLSTIYDEPFSDSSQIPTFFVSKAARSEVTVALSGDGGDECFAGYNRHTWVGRFWALAGWMPAPLRSATAGLFQALPPERWDRVLGALIPSRMRPRLIGDKVHKASDLLRLECAEEVYRRLVSHWNNPEALLHEGNEPKTLIDDSDTLAALPGSRSRTQFLDMGMYLPDDILTKVDRASMAVSLEVRVPLLDHRIVEFAWRLPGRFKFRGGRSKWILRKVLEGYIPQSVFERPKQGFGIPIGDWLRGPLRDWAEHLLESRRIESGGLIKSVPVLERWNEHLSGTRNHQYAIWNFLMFQAWRERWDSSW